MKITNIAIALLFFSLIISCNSREEKKVERIKDKLKDISSFNELLEHYEIITLKQPDSLIIGGLTSVSMIDNSHYIFIVTNEHEVFKFDKDGNFIRKFSKIGKSESEYTSIGSIEVSENKSILINDVFSRKIIEYDSLFNYKKTIYKKYGYYGAVLYLSGKDLYIYTPVSSSSPILLYDYNTGDFVKEIGTKNEKIFATNFFIENSAFDLDLTKDSLYYMFPNQYILNKASKSGIVSQIISKPNYFIEANQKINVRDENRKYDIINKIFVNAITLFVQTTFENRQKYLYFDIISKEGEVLKTKLKYDQSWMLKRTRDKEYFYSIGYDWTNEKKGLSNNIPIVVKIFKIKKYFKDLWKIDIVLDL